MKRILIVLAATLALSGCETFVRKEVVVEYKYVVRKATDQQKDKPAYPTPIDLDTANQLDLANWLKLSEERQFRLEAIIDGLVTFYEQTVTDGERTAAGEPLKPEAK
jgi:uncharacterized protein YceK